MRYANEGWRLLTWLRARVLNGSSAPRAVPPPRSARVVFVQYGDYSDAYRRLQQPGGDETYYAQRYTIDFVAELAKSNSVDWITVLTFSRDEPLTELAPRLRTAGVELYPERGSARHAALVREVERLDPTHLIVSAPIVPLMRWGLGRGIPVLPLFADSFRGASLRNKLRNLRLAYVLNDPRIRYVANHNLAASLELARIGVSASKIVPYDWPAVTSPKEFPAKPAPSAEGPFKLVYVGQVTEQKGVGDLIHAVAELSRTGQAVELKIIGARYDESLPSLAKQLGVDERISFLGTRTHSDVRKAMREADAVVVPSRHEYPEGLPMTLYEGLCARTPLIVSDHPMFKLRIKAYENALVFAAGSPAALAARVRELASDADLYVRLSQNAERAAEGYLCPLKWDRLIAAWLDPQHSADIDQHRLAESVNVSAFA
ncbi:MAG: glycosyl transferase group 1 [Myxococcaceae bacterium]|nr:glycosyl transferase group 1 [Myxococcaceae bacterium]